MNQLSKLLYLGNVAGNLGPFCVFLGIAFLGIAIIVFIVHNSLCAQLVEKLKYSRADDDPIVLKALKYRVVPLWSPVFLAVSVFFWFCAVLSPSSDTVYAIAASEMGEKALQTPLAGKAEQALEAWLNSKIKQATAPVQATQ